MGSIIPLEAEAWTNLADFCAGLDLPVIVPRSCFGGDASLQGPKHGYRLNLAWLFLCPLQQAVRLAVRLREDA